MEKAELSFIFTLYRPIQQNYQKLPNATKSKFCNTAFGGCRTFGIWTRCVFQMFLKILESKKSFSQQQVYLLAVDKNKQNSKQVYKGLSASNKQPNLNKK